MTANVSHTTSSSSYSTSSCAIPPSTDMPNTQSAEKVDLLRLLGAEVRLAPAVPVSDPTHYTFQARDAAAGIPNAVWTNQFDSTDNRAAHEEMTGPEIWAQTGGRVDAFTCATGTGGTLAGTARFLKQVGRVLRAAAGAGGALLRAATRRGSRGCPQRRCAR